MTHIRLTIDHAVAVDLPLDPTMDEDALGRGLEALAGLDDGVLRATMAVLLAGYGTKHGKGEARRLLKAMIAGLVLIPDEGEGVA